MNDTSKIGELRTMASEMLTKIKNALPNQGEIWGRNVYQVRLNQGDARFGNDKTPEKTMRKFAENLMHDIHSVVEDFSENLRALKPSLGNNRKIRLQTERLRSKVSYDKWMEGSGRYTPLEREHINQKIGGQNSLRSLVKNQSLTQAVIRDNRISNEEALVLHARAEKEQINANKDDMIKKALDNGLSKLPQHTGDCYVSVPRTNTYVLGRSYGFPNGLLASDNKDYVNDGETVLIIRSQSGKSVREFTKSNNLREVLFPLDARFKVSEIIQNSEGVSTVILSDTNM